MKYMIGADFGGSSSKATLLGEDGRVVATASCEYPTYYPVSGWAEQDPEDSWKAFVYNIRELLAKSGVSASDIVPSPWTQRRTPPSCWIATTVPSATRSTGRTPAPPPRPPSCARNSARRSRTSPSTAYPASGRCPSSCGSPATSRRTLRAPKRSWRSRTTSATA